MITGGEILDGYLILRLIGSGGFGQVWLCESQAVGDLRAVKFIPAADEGRIAKEFDAICRYRTSAGQLRSPFIMSIEHVNRRADGLYYIMPLADGYGAEDPRSEDWRPWSLAEVLRWQRSQPAWLGSEEIKAYVRPILQALQLLSDVGLVHRDVKPDNILLFNGQPCLGDISLLGEDSLNITMRGTPGYAAPSWYIESGGHPDMYGAATTLYTLLTGNPPDKMGRAAFKWPPQGEKSLSQAQRNEWLRLTSVIRRAVDERPAERFRDFAQFLAAVDNAPDTTPAKPRRKHFKVYAATAIAALAMAGLLVFLLGRSAPLPRESRIARPPESPRTAPDIRSGEIPGVVLDNAKKFEAALDKATQELTYSRADFSEQVDRVAQDLERIHKSPSMRAEEAASNLALAKTAFETALKKVPPRPSVEQRSASMEELRRLASGGGSSAMSPTEVQFFASEFRPRFEEDIRKLSSQLETEAEFRLEQMKKVMSPAMRIRNHYAAPPMGELFGADATTPEKAEAAALARKRAVETSTDIYTGAQRFFAN